MHLDTSFLVDLLREHARRQPGPATAFLEENAGEHLRVGVHAVCELYAGAELARAPAAERRRVRRLCAALDVAYPDDRFPLVYGRVLATLEHSGQRIGAMDLLIAAAALVDSAPIVTRNTHDFSRVPGLDVVSY
jgi:predicted nucleic acid-binding protein